MRRKIYVVGDDFEYANWMGGKLTQTIEEADLIVFTGGEDVDPSLYGEKRNPQTYSNITRDRLEEKEYLKALQLHIPIIGICRGAQLLCVMNGGRVVQHQENKYGQHPVIMKDGSVQNITSTHHQAMYPFNLDRDEYELLGWGENLSNFHLDGESRELSLIDNGFKEAEIVYFPKTRCLGIQGHPEYSFQDKKTLEYLQNLLEDFLNNKL